ncbi:MAG: glutamine amidotransferase [Micrococcales bacterium]|nr:MAG: glutamine amidotransferase [Micrococcales bacterium]PIE26292.1 MAG: glutamine amidotransferase [Micrococcales bacterium]
MKPFLLLATRAEDAPADDEYRAMLQYSGLAPTDLVRHRLERDPLPRMDLDAWSGIILAGGPFNASDPPASKSAAQLRVESELHGLLNQVVPADFPMLGACYGIGTIGTHQGGLVDTTYSEPVSCVQITLTEHGRADPLFDGVPSTFGAFVGHKEAISRLPDNAVHLAGSAECPVQAFKVGQNVYATQFHPELDSRGIDVRVDAYQHHGYFHPREVAGLKAMGRAASIPYAGRMLEAFARRYAQD